MNRRGPNIFSCGTPETIRLGSTHNSTINYDSLPVVGEELPTNEQHTATKPIDFNLTKTPL